MSGITTHVLDTAAGKPASGLSVRLECSGAGGWTECGSGTTDPDGRLRTLLPGAPAPGLYRITFDSGAYFKSTGKSCFYPHISVIFEVADGSQHYHVPLLLSPYGYSTYRGS